MSEQSAQEGMATKKDPASNQAQGAEPSGPKGDNPATAGPGETHVKSNTPEHKDGHLNPSAPGEASTTPGTSGEK